MFDVGWFFNSHGEGYGVWTDDGYQTPIAMGLTEKVAKAIAEEHNNARDNKTLYQDIARELLDANRGGHKITEKTAQWAEKILREGS